MQATTMKPQVNALLAMVLASILLADAVAGARQLQENPGEWEKCLYPKPNTWTGVRDKYQTVCYKRRNDGTATCHQFCTSNKWGYAYKKCYGGLDTVSKRVIDCDEVLDETRTGDAKRKEVICYCSLD